MTQTLPAAIRHYAEGDTPAVLVRPHVIVLIGAAGYAAWSFTLAYYLSGILQTLWASGANTGASGPPMMFMAALVLGGLFVLAPMVSAITRLVMFYTSVLMVTPAVLVTVTGIARRVRTLELGKSETLGVDETLLGRFVGYGYLKIHGIGGGRVAAFPIAQPHNVLRDIKALF